MGVTKGDKLAEEKMTTAGFEKDLGICWLRNPFLFIIRLALDCLSMDLFDSSADLFVLFSC